MRGCGGDARAFSPSGAVATLGGLAGAARAVAVADADQACLVAVAAGREVVVWTLDRDRAVVDPVARRACLRCVAPAAVTALALTSDSLVAVDAAGDASWFALTFDDAPAAFPRIAAPARRLDRGDVAAVATPEEGAAGAVAFATRASVPLLARADSITAGPGSAAPLAF